MADLIDLTRGTRFESIVRDPGKLREAMLNAMKASDDPLTREIGTGIANGTMAWRTLATNPAYREYLDQNMEAMRNLDFARHFDALAAEREATARQQAERREVEESDDPVQGPILRRRK